MEKPVIKEDEIDLIEIAKVIWNEKMLVIKTTVAFFLLGILIAFGSKEEFETSCKLMPENQEGIKSNFGGLGSLAGLAGINLNFGGEGALTPELYPEIARSMPFLLQAWETPIYFAKHDTITSSYQYFKEIDKPSLTGIIIKYTIGLPFEIREWFTPDKDQKATGNFESDPKIIRLSNEDTKLLKHFKERISVSVDVLTGAISLSTKMPDAESASQLAQHSIEILTDYVTDYKISKAKVNYDFVKDRYDEAKDQFESIQQELAIFNDQNKNVVTAMAQTESQRLENEYNIRYEVFKGLATQLEQAKITLKEETPVFTVLEPVVVPVKKTSPQRIIILISSIIIGLILGVVLIFARSAWKKVTQGLIS